MKTLVVQSYRTTDVAGWIGRCLASVRSWAAPGCDYEFVDDRLFDYAPPWVRQRCGAEILPVTDIARLYLMRERLRQGWERVVWIDADVLVFAPERFVLDDRLPYALCRELWLHESGPQALETSEWVNNAVIVMTPGQPLLDFWLFAAEEILRTHPPGPVGKLIVGTHLLTDLAKAMPLRVLNDVGLFSPPVIRDLARGGGPAARAWAQRFGHPIAAANLCASLQDREAGGARVDEADLERAVDTLLKSRGAMLDARVEDAPVIGVA